MVLAFYMKSGNVIRLSGVKSWKVNTAGNEVVGLTIERTWLASRFRFRTLLINTINLAQIEAVVVHHWLF